MASSELLQLEDITMEFETWTFDSSVLTPSTEEGEEDFFVFPDEVESLFYEYGAVIYAHNAEIFEPTEVDGKEAFVFAGVRPIAVIEPAFPEDDEDYDPAFLVEGGKILFYGDIFLSHNPTGAIARF